MAADIDHLGHDTLADAVGLLWVESYIGIHRVMYQTIGDAFAMRCGRASPLALEPSAWQPQCQIGHCALSSRQGHLGEMMCGSGGGKMGGRGAGGDDSYKPQIHTSNDDGGRRHPTAAMGPTTPGFYTWYGASLGGSLCNTCPTDKSRVKNHTKSTNHLTNTITIMVVEPLAPPAMWI